MKQVLILLIAVLFFSFPMILQADPGKKDMTKATTIKPLPAMKSTLQSPSATKPGEATSSKATGQSLAEVDAVAGKAKEESSDAAKSMMDDAKKMGAKKSMDEHK